MELGYSSDRPIRTGALRYLIAICLAWGLILADAKQRSITATVRDQISSWVIVPVRFAAQLPTAAWSTTSDYFKSRNELIVAKQELEERLLRERAGNHLALQIENQNAELRRLLEVRERQPDPAIVAEVVNTASLPFINRIVLDKGSGHGVQAGQGIYNDQGVIGRLARVDQNSSQALLLTDKRFWVATRLRRSNTLVLLQGDGSGRMRLRFVPADVDIKQGELLVTADGHGPFPAGLPVAVVDRVWQPEGIPFLEGEALPVANVLQNSALLVHDGSTQPLDEQTREATDIVPANYPQE